MITPITKLPCKEEFESIIEECGYNYYIPWELLNDLTTLHICNGLNQSIEELNKIPKYIPAGKENFYHMVQELYSKIDFSDYSGHTPAHKAIFTLKDLSKLIDFRKLDNLEENILSPIQNYVEILDESSNEIMVKEDGKLDTEEIAKIVKLSCRIGASLPNKNTYNFNEKNNLKMKSYSEVKKSRKSNMIRPDFKQNLAALKLFIPSKISKTFSEDALIYLEDASSSMVDNKGLIISKAIQLMILKDPRTVHYYRYAGKYLETHILNTVEDKIKCFSSPKVYKSYNCDYSSLFDLMESTYERGNIIISTDAVDYVSKNRKTNLTYNCICAHTQYIDSDMRSFIINSGGKYLSI